MRRLLENGANTSFVNKINNPKLNIKEIIEDPIEIIEGYSQIPNPRHPANFEFDDNFSKRIKERISL